MKICLRIIASVFLGIALLSCTVQKPATPRAYSQFTTGQQVISKVYLPASAQSTNSFTVGYLAAPTHADTIGLLPKSISSKRSEAIAVKGENNKVTAHPEKSQKGQKDKPPVNKNSKISFISSLLGLASIFFTLAGIEILVLFVLFCPIIAVVYGYKALQQIEKEPGKYRGKKLAKAGIILGIIDMALAIILTALIYIYIVYYT